MPPPPALQEELVEEILLRFPPGEPASLLRAALVCKRWCRLVSGPGFRRRFREFHRTPPMLGMVLYGNFVPTTAFRPRHAEHADVRVVDARHGRVLFHGGGKSLVVWDPITDEEWKLQFPSFPPQYRAFFSWVAALLCSVGDCDHLDCHRRPFTVVLLCTVFGGPGKASVAWTYSSDAAAWSEPTYGPQHGYRFNPWMMRSALVGNSLYFGTMDSRTALKYNVQSRLMSLIQLPPSVLLCRSTLLTTTKDGGLLLAAQHESKLCVWLRKDDDDADARCRWERSRVIDLDMLLPVDVDFTSLNVVGSTDDLGIIFLKADDVVFAIDLKTYKVKKVYEGRVQAIVPFMSFYTPELEATYAGEGPSDEIGLSA